MSVPILPRASIPPCPSLDSVGSGMPSLLWQLIVTNLNRITLSAHACEWLAYRPWFSLSVHGLRSDYGKFRRIPDTFSWFVSFVQGAICKVPDHPTHLMFAYSILFSQISNWPSHLMHWAVDLWAHRILSLLATWFCRNHKTVCGWWLVMFSAFRVPGWQLYHLCRGVSVIESKSPKSHSSVTEWPWS